ncbi:MAG: hypothetical protein JWM54_1113 [Acidobacteriaceae bacterium]|nr:hypothetical protein [Acidobacteriaceae bacterium]
MTGLLLFLLICRDSIRDQNKAVIGMTSNWIEKWSNAPSLYWFRNPVLETSGVTLSRWAFKRRAISYAARQYEPYLPYLPSHRGGAVFERDNMVLRNGRVIGIDYGVMREHFIAAHCGLRNSVWIAPLFLSNSRGVESLGHCSHRDYVKPRLYMQSDAGPDVLNSFLNTYFGRPIGEEFYRRSLREIDLHPRSVAYYQSIFGYRSCRSCGVSSLSAGFRGLLHLGELTVVNPERDETNQPKADLTPKSSVGDPVNILRKVIGGCAIIAGIVIATLSHYALLYRRKPLLGIPGWLLAAAFIWHGLSLMGA